MTSKRFEHINGPKAHETMGTIADRFARPMDIAGQPFPDMSRIMPNYEEIPKDFRMFRDSNPFVKLQSEWFFQGLKAWPLMPKSGIDPSLAIAHLSAIQGSWEPKHEHKVAAVAWLMSLWFDVPPGEKE